MATFGNISLIVACIVVSSSLMIQTGLSRNVPEPSNGPSTEIDYAPGPSPSSYDKYLTYCASMLDPHCSVEIFSAIFLGDQIVGDRCCDSLLEDVGKECFDAITKYILTWPMFRSNETQTWHKSQEIWEYCILQGYPRLEPISLES